MIMEWPRTTNPVSVLYFGWDQIQKPKVGVSEINVGKGYVLTEKVIHRHLIC